MLYAEIDDCCARVERRTFIAINIIDLRHQDPDAYEMMQ